MKPKNLTPGTYGVCVVHQKRIGPQEVSKAENSFSSSLMHPNSSTQEARSVVLEEKDDEGVKDSFVNGKKFCVDHSKNGRAKCRKCKKVILAGLLWIEKNVQSKEK